MNPRRKQVAGLAALTLLAAPVACSKSDSDRAATVTTSPSGSTSATKLGGEGAGDESATAGVTVTIQGLKFQQPAVTIKAGQTVTFKNADSAVHIPTSGTPDADTGVFSVTVEGGKSAATPALETGTYTYFCQVHPSMKGEIVVE